MKRNWAAGLFRAVVVIFSITVITYKVIEAILQHKNPIEELLPGDAALAFAIQFVAIPFLTVIMLAGAVRWVIRGFRQPKLNWKEGLTRAGWVITIISIIIIWCVLAVQLENLSAALGILLVILVLFLIAYSVGDWIDRGLQKRQDNEYDDEEYDEHDDNY